MFRKVLVANRGEIACRVCRTLRAMGVRSVAIHSEADRGAPHARLADEAVEIGPPPAAQSYLDGEKVVRAAAALGCDAIHPGYGFLSESPDFARRCAESGIAFVGPSPAVLEALGKKAGQRALVAAAGVPVVPGSGLVESAEQAIAEALRIGFPVLLKATAGGGGIGMVQARSAEELAKQLENARKRALSTFKDAGVYLERLIERPRHVEVQVACDRRGAAIHLFERECSIQRRHQKVVEETPSPALTPALRERLCLHGLALARAFSYDSVGTLEFLLAPDGALYFIEMNKRIQVEHPITEETTGLDLVRLQLLAAAGEPLGVAQEEVRPRGHAIEWRVYAEDPDKGFLPSPGRIAAFEPPAGDGVRVDAGVEAGSAVTPFYDPLLAKLVCRGADRAEAIERSAAALGRFRVEGVKTNLPLLRAIAAEDAFRAGAYDTEYLARTRRG